MQAKMAVKSYSKELDADEPGFARAVKSEFAVHFRISENHLNLIQQARREFDRTDDIPSELSSLINQHFTRTFAVEVVPFLTIPIE